jgi:iron-sulfur cluster assembly accessory protein
MVEVKHMDMMKQKENDVNSLPVLQLTSAAVEKVKAMMDKDGKQNYGLRVDVVTGGCAGLSYDLRFQKSPYENDIILEQDGLRIFVNPESVSFLKGVEIHYVDTLKESGFQYRNPNAHSSCGCGVSFS